MGSEHSSVLDNEKGHQRILVLRRTEKRKLMNHLQKVSCNTPIQQFLSFSKGQKRKKKIRTRKAWEQFDKLGRNCDLCGEVYEEEQNKETYTLKIQLRMTLPCTRVLFSLHYSYDVLRHKLTDNTLSCSSFIPNFI